MKKYTEQIRKKLLRQPQPTKGWEDRLIRTAVAHPQDKTITIIGPVTRLIINAFYRQRLLAPALAFACLLALVFWNPVGSYLIPQDNLLGEAFAYTEDITGVEDALQAEVILAELEEINAWIPLSD